MPRCYKLDYLINGKYVPTVFLLSRYRIRVCEYIGKRKRFCIVVATGIDIAPAIGTPESQCLFECSKKRFV